MTPAEKTDRNRFESRRFIVPPSKQIFRESFAVCCTLAGGGLNMWGLGKALRDRIEQPRLIETVPKRGYRFIAAVRQVGEMDARAAAPARGGIVPSTIQNFRSLRPAVWAAFAAMLVLVGG